MKKQAINTVKLGVFVLAGLLFLIVLLYMIGRNQSLFGSTFIVKARFENVQGLVSGNNVRYAGIQVGTVKKIRILNDTLIEVVMIVDDKMKPFIRSNAIATIGSEGLMGNKIINLSPSREQAPLISEGDMLVSRKAIDTDEMLRTLGKTNNDISIVAENLKSTISRINTSNALWKLLNDSTLPLHLSGSAANLQLATARAALMVTDLQMVAGDIKNGKGSLGAIIKDTSFAVDLREALAKINSVAARADELAASIQAVVADVSHDLNHGKGPVNALLKDSSLVMKLNISLDNIQKGTEAFSQDMEALKHNIFFRGYFRRLEKQKRKEQPAARIALQ